MAVLYVGPQPVPRVGFSAAFRCARGLICRIAGRGGGGGSLYNPRTLVRRMSNGVKHRARSSFSILASCQMVIRALRHGAPSVPPRKSAKHNGPLPHPPAHSQPRLPRSPFSKVDRVDVLSAGFPLWEMMKGI